MFGEEAKHAGDGVLEYQGRHSVWRPGDSNWKCHLVNALALYRATEHAFLLAMGLPGLEPGTSRLSGERSNQLSYRPIQRRYGSSGVSECQERVLILVNGQYMLQKDRGAGMAKDGRSY